MCYRFQTLHPLQLQLRDKFAVISKMAVYWSLYSWLASQILFSLDELLSTERFLRFILVVSWWATVFSSYRHSTIWFPKVQLSTGRWWMQSQPSRHHQTIRLFSRPSIHCPIARSLLDQYSTDMSLLHFNSSCFCIECCSRSNQNLRSRVYSKFHKKLNFEVSKLQPHSFYVFERRQVTTSREIS